MVRHHWTGVSKVLHVLIGLCVIIQLSALMFKWYIPADSRLYAYRSTVFEAHIYDGLFFFWVALAFFCYKLFIQQGQSARRLYPYFSSDITKVFQDIKSVLCFRLPVREGGGLAGCIQGLGVLLILGLGLSGTFAFITWHQFANLPVSGATIMMWHHLLGNILYWYLVGHVGMALVHRLVPKRFWVCYDK